VHEGVYVGLLAVRAQDSDATVAANNYLKQMFRYPASKLDSDMQPLVAARFVNAADRVALIERLLSAGSVENWLVRMRRDDWSEMSVEITAHAEPAANGMLPVDAVLRDVTQQTTSAERSRELQHEESAHAQRLAALGYALSSVAHELNNPLTSIIAWAERISEAPLSDDARRGTPLILREAQRAARIVRNLLTLSRKRPSTRTLVDVNAIIRETLALRAHEQRTLRISVTAALTPVLPTVFVDGHQIQQVLLNLIINAEQAMSAAHGRGALMICSSYDATHRRVQVEVGDDGPGIPEPVSDRIFDPFFTTKATGEGTGLGLTVAHAIILDHGGEICVSARPSGGAVFTVSLPIATDGASPERRDH